MDKICNKDFKQIVKNLDESEKLKYWIKTLLESYTALPELIKTVDHILEIQATSLSFSGSSKNGEWSALGQVEKVIDIGERKRTLVNIYLLTKKLFSFLDNDDIEFAKKRYIYKYTMDELAYELGITTRSVYRRSDRCLKKIYDGCVRSKYTCRFIESQVLSEFWLKDRFIKNVKNSLSKERDEYVYEEKNLA